MKTKLIYFSRTLVLSDNKNQTVDKRQTKEIKLYVTYKIDIDGFDPIRKTATNSIGWERGVILQSFRTTNHFTLPRNETS